MARTKTTKAGGGNREGSETKAQRLQRLKDEKAALDACGRILPFAAGAVLLLVFAFALYVRSVPPVERPVPAAPPAQSIDLADYTNEELGKMAESSPDGEFKSTVEAFLLMRFEAEKRAAEGGREPGEGMMDGAPAAEEVVEL
jgi:hypothetical protein